MRAVDTAAMATVEPAASYPCWVTRTRSWSATMVTMTALWIARIWEYDPGAQAIHVLITDGSDQRQFILRRPENADLYDFIVAHRRD